LRLGRHRRQQNCNQGEGGETSEHFFVHKIPTSFFVVFGGCVALLGPEGKRSPLDPIPRLVESAGIEMKRGVVGRRSGLKLTTPSVNVFVITACTAYK
jgi:hypothetical protein